MDSPFVKVTLLDGTVTTMDRDEAVRMKEAGLLLIPDPSGNDPLTFHEVYGEDVDTMQTMWSDDGDDD